LTGCADSRFIVFAVVESTDFVISKMNRS
jgi:hypothetical protein